MEWHVAIAVLCIAVGGIGSQWLAWWFRIPAIVLLFAVGLAVGPALQLIHPSAALGPALRPLVGLVVAIVVFEGGLSLNFRDLRAAGEGVLRLTAIALPINWTLAAFASHFIAGFGWGTAVLFGAITVVTGPTVVLPLLRHVRLRKRAAAFLRWEAIVNDPIGAILAALTLEALAGGGGPAHVALSLVAGLAVSCALGIGCGLLVRFSFTRDLVPEFLKTPVLFALALTIASLSNLVMPESGLMAATVFGIAVANLGIVGVAELRRFKEALVVLVVSALFVALTADLDRAVLGRVGWGVILLTAAMIVLVRPAAILLATLKSGMSWQERLLTGWIAPRGIVAAAMAGVAGLRLHDAGYAGTDLIMPAVFALIATTMLLHGFSLGPLARRLGLHLGEGDGVLILGASRWSTDLAVALHGIGVDVTLSDTYPGALRSARRHGVPVLQAEILSRHGEEAIEERPIDYVIATTPDEVYNGLVCARLAPELGRERVFQVAPSESGTDSHTGMTRDLRGKVFASAELDYANIEAMHRNGARFEIAELGESPSGEPERAGYALVVVRKGGGLFIASPENPASVSARLGDRALYLVPAESQARSGEHKAAVQV
jgi:NhaP-type Na+/H+ or K+/H+ antiporter